MRTRIPLFLLLLVLASCTRKPATPLPAEPSEPPTLDLSGDRTDLLFTWVDADGKLHDVDAADKVPVERRKQVLVRDLSKSPDEVQADRYVFLADVSREEGGFFRYVVVSRHAMDRSLRQGDLVADQEHEADGGRPEVVLYGTSWCGACVQARKWLREKGIVFADKDVEKDERAQAEMARKARRAGLQFGGVPVIDVRGRLLQGFDPAEIERLLAGSD